MPTDQAWPREKQSGNTSQTTAADIALRYWCAAGFYAVIATAIAFLAHWPWVVVPGVLTAYAVIKALTYSRAT